MKRLSFWLALLLCAALCLPACAESIALEPVLENIGRIEYVDETDYLLVRDSATRLYGVYSVTGEKLMPCEHGALFDLKYGYFEAIEEEGLNNHALLDATGRVVIGYEYAAYEQINARWCAAVTLEATEGELYDYSGGFMGGGEHYLVTSYDIYDLSAGAKVGSFTRDQYERCVALGDFLYIEDKSDKITAYDATLTAQSGEIEYMSAPFDTADGKCVNLANGEVVLENCSSVSVNSDTEHFRAWRNNMVGLYDIRGNELIPAEYESIGMEYDGYAPVKQNGLMGLYSITEGKLVVPCEYDDVPYFGLGTINRYMHNGYACVKKDSKLGFVNANGEVTCEVKYAENAVTQHGCTLVVTDMDGALYIVAGDGTQTKTEYAEIDKHSGGDGSLLIVSDGENYGLADWHGNVVLPLEYKSYDIEITDNANAVIVGDTVYAVKRGE